MIVFPAIDLRRGRCVRLAQGRFEAETRYSEDPLAVAAGFAASGATWLHVVDLDGARAPAERQTGLLARLAAESGLQLQLGGGLRRREELVELFAFGCARVVVGSLAVREPDTVAAWLQEFGAERLVLALDVRIDADGTARVAHAGWQEGSALRLEALIERFLPAGLKHVLCTDIARDGMLSGPNGALYAGLRARYPELALIASGGVAGLADVSALAEAGIKGAVIGKALYEGRFRLEEAIACSRAA